MRSVVTIFWAIILGQVIGFIGASLTSTTYQPLQTAIIAAIFGAIVSFLPLVLKSFAVAPAHSTQTDKKAK